jgi:hypothetical protein
VSRLIFAVTVTASSRVMEFPAVTILAPRLIPPVPASRVIEALSEPVICPFTVMDPAPAGERIVTGSKKVTAPLIVIAPVPVALPIVIEVNPLARAAISEAIRSRVPTPVSAAPPMAMAWEAV